MAFVSLQLVPASPGTDLWRFAEDEKGKLELSPA